MNSGKPQDEPFTNSFAIIFAEEKDRENIFLVAYSLWKTKFWFPHLCGSVIPFLHLTDFKKHFNRRPKAVDCAKYNGLYGPNAKVVIEEVTLNIIEEI
jgi:hypothetical protein